ncbi:hypothetical protein PQX77_018038 [Marasmius sp. AFHP31]|nr:hypothetical protein PQX77_018038 [Marasmius sp. AFHP31]
MLDLQKYFGKKLFNGCDFVQVYKPAMEGVAKAEGLWENLTGEDKDIPSLDDTVTPKTIGTGTQAGTRTVPTPPFESEIAKWNANNMLKGFMQLNMTCEMYILIKDMTAADAWDYLKETYGRPTLSNIYGDFLKAATFTINQNDPLSSTAKLHTYFRHLNTVDVNIPKLVKALILVHAIPKVWEAAASKCSHDFYSGTNTPSFQQQQHPHPLQHQQQCGQQQQNYQQCKGKKKKQQQQQGMRGGIDRDAGNFSGNRPHGHSHFASVASTITPPFSSVTKHKDRVALNAIKQSLHAEIATKPNNLWAGYCPPSTWDETYPDLNFKAASHLPSSHARGSPPPATFKGFWDRLCNSTLAQLPPQVKKNPATMQKFMGFKPMESVSENVCESRSLADRIGVPKTAQYLKLLKAVVVTEACHTDKLASKTCFSLQKHIGAVASSSKCTLEDNDGHEYCSSHSSKHCPTLIPLHSDALD